jgi:hypothetical protein
MQHLPPPRTPASRAAGRPLRRSLDQALGNQRRPERVDQGREVAEVVGAFFAGVTEGLDLGLGREDGTKSYRRSPLAMGLPAERIGGPNSPRCSLHCR